MVGSAGGGQGGDGGDTWVSGEVKGWVREVEREGEVNVVGLKHGWFSL